MFLLIWSGWSWGDEDLLSTNLCHFSSISILGVQTNSEYVENMLTSFSLSLCTRRRAGRELAIISTDSTMCCIVFEAGDMASCLYRILSWAAQSLADCFVVAVASSISAAPMNIDPQRNRDAS